jgi:zinc protease
MRRSLLALTLALFACSAEPWVPSSRWPEMTSRLAYDLPATAGKLKANGVRWVIQPDATESLVELDVRVEAGAAEDPPGKPGLAHLVEHLMFQQRPGGAQAPRTGTLIGQATLWHNAFTSLDATTYEDLARPDQLETLIRLEGARFATGCGGIDAVSFEREREVVRNELRERGEIEPDAPFSQLSLAVFGKDHPYAHAVGGTDVALAGLTLDDACRFVADYYAPSRLIVAVSGHVDGEHVKALLVRHFGTAPARTPRPRASIELDGFRAGHLEGKADVGHPVVYWAFPVPARLDDLGAETDLLIDDLEEGVAARFASDAAVSDSSVFELGDVRRRVVVIAVAARAPRDLAPVRNVVGGLLDDLLDEIAQVHRFHLDVSGELRRRFVLGSLFALEPLAGRTQMLSDYLQYAPGQHFGREIAHVDHPDQVLERLRRAGSYLEDARALHLVVEPSGHGGAHAHRASAGFTGMAPEDVVTDDTDPALARLPVTVPERDHQTGARQLVLPNGLHVVLQPRRSRLPLVTTRLVFAVGSSAEPAGKAGVAKLAALLFRFGTFGAPAGLYEGAGLHAGRAAFAGQAEGAGLEVGHDTTSMIVRHAANDTAIVLHSLALRLNGQADAWPLVHVLQVMTRSLAGEPPTLEALGRFALVAGLYGREHIYARSAGPTLRSVMHIDAEDVLAYFQRNYVAANATLIVVGDFDPAAIEAGIRDEFGRWPAGKPTPITVPAAAARTAAIHLGVDTRDRDAAEQDQLALAIGYPSPAGIDAHHAARLVLTRMLDLRLQAVRERLGASYGVTTTLVIENGPGAYRVEGRVALARAGESLALLRAGIDALRRGDGFDAEFVRARRLVLAELMASASSSWAIADEWAFQARFGLPDDFDEQLTQAVAHLTPAQVRAVVDAELVPEHEVVVVTGPRAAVEQAYAGAGLPPPRFMKHWPAPAAAR